MELSISMCFVILQDCTTYHARRNVLSADLFAVSISGLDTGLLCSRATPKCFVGLEPSLPVSIGPRGEASPAALTGHLGLAS